jgi:ubiquinone/menaquinone biosynthesis C-methylase UbiE
MPDISEINLKTYSKPFETWKYARLTGLLPAEAAILQRYHGEIAGRPILDIGVGGGRTTESLLEISSDYVGADYSAAMVERCRARFPGIRFEVVDARDLSAFGDESFALVMFSYNGISSLDHDDRLRALREMRRVLSPDGICVFSAHNRNSPQTGAWSLKNIPPIENWLKAPVPSLKQLVKYPIGIRNALANRKHERNEADYAIVNDEAGCYGLMSYVITVEKQLAQLRSVGLSPLEAVGTDGDALNAGEYGTHDAWVYYVARRA